MHEFEFSFDIGMAPEIGFHWFQKMIKFHYYHSLKQMKEEISKQQ